MKAPAPPAPTQLWTVEQARDLLGVGHDKIYRLMRSGELAYIQLPPGTKRAPRRIEQAEIDRFLAANRRGGNATQ